MYGVQNGYGQAGQLGQARQTGQLIETASATTSLDNSGSTVFAISMAAAAIVATTLAILLMNAVLSLIVSEAIDDGYASQVYEYQVQSDPWLDVEVDPFDGRGYDGYDVFDEEFYRLMNGDGDSRV